MLICIYCFLKQSSQCTFNMSFSNTGHGDQGSPGKSAFLDDVDDEEPIARRQRQNILYFYGSWKRQTEGGEVVAGINIVYLHRSSPTRVMAFSGLFRLKVASASVI